MSARALALAAAAASAVAAAVLAATPEPAGKVTFLAGYASRTSRGEAEKLSVGTAVFQGDVVETQRRTRLELKLADGSVLRLGSSSQVEVKDALFGKTVEERRVSVKLLVGKIWANVAKAVGGDQRFEVQTESAVAGVRGTTFRVDAATDRSVVVKVYSGTVAVASAAVPRPAHEGEEPTGALKGKPARRRIAGPQEVTREQWEKIVTSMMEVRVSSEGVPTEPQAFAMAAAGQDEWEEWNRNRDFGKRPGGDPAR